MYIYIYRGGRNEEIARFSIRFSLLIRSLGRGSGGRRRGHVKFILNVKRTKHAQLDIRSRNVYIFIIYGLRDK